MKPLAYLLALSVAANAALAILFIRSNSSPAHASSQAAAVAGASQKTGDAASGASSPAAGKVEVHETAMNNGVATMRPVKGGLSIPPGQSITLAPGGYHLMMTELKGPLKKGDKLVVTLAFEKAGEVKATFDVQGVGATGSTSGQMDHSMPGMQQPMKMKSDHKM